MADQREAVADVALRVGFLSPVDSLAPDLLSGMPYRMRAILESRGLEIVALDRPSPAPGRRIVPEAVRRRVPPAARYAWRTTRKRIVAGLEWTTSSTYERRMLRLARTRAVVLSRRVRDAAPDVLFGCCISSMMYGLETNVPIVYFSDATARIINTTYPAYRARSPAYKRLCDLYERETMARVTFGAFASQRARESAVVDYGLDRSLSHVIPMGAHITPDSVIQQPIDAPTQSDLRLCIIASDPRRKRVDLAVQIIERLRRMGWKATLTHIGQPSRYISRCPFARSLGSLCLASAADRTLMAETLASSHLMVLPSVGEAFGIAPCEAAHFGRPSVVSTVGGLPEVVENGRSGIVLSVGADAGDYAEAIAELAKDEPRYRRMSQAALARAKSMLNWDAWADGITSLIYSAAARTVPRIDNFITAATDSPRNRVHTQSRELIEI